MAKKPIKPKRLFRCRQCRGMMHVTATAHMTIRDDGTMVVENFGIDHARWYCENGHEASYAHDYSLRDYYAGLDTYGRQPGAGTLDIEVFPHVKATAGRR